MPKIDDNAIKSYIFSYYELVEEIERKEIKVFDRLNFENKELFSDIGAVEIYDLTFSSNTSATEHHKNWFDKLIENPHLSNTHAVNLDDGGLQDSYARLIEEGLEILKLMNNQVLE